MPIRPERRQLYPGDWQQISSRIRFERAGGRCECRGECGQDHKGQCIHSHGSKMMSGRVCVLTVAHLNHDETDCRDENLCAMCQGCHNRYDMAHRLEGRRRRQHIHQMDAFDDPSQRG